MFAVSIIFTLISSYFLLSVIDKKTCFKNNLGFIFFIIIAFCLITFELEFLSLFKIMFAKNLIIANIIILFLSMSLWFINDKNFYIPKIKGEYKKIKKALKKDYILKILSICFIIFILSELYMALFFPVKYGDAISYYFSRCTMWIQNGSISHYITTDPREIIMPVNADLLYAWMLMLKQNETGAGIFPFIFYINGIYTIYNFLGLLGFCRRKRIWSIFVFSSFTLVYIEAQIPGSDLWAGSMLLTGIYLLYCAVKNNPQPQPGKNSHMPKNICLYFSALYFAIAFGVKTTAIIAFPSVFIIMLTIMLLYKRTEIKSYFTQLMIFLIINFLIFSSYNYILNYLDFQNPLSDKTQLLINSFRGGIKGYLTNLIKYIFASLDFSGMTDYFGLGTFIEKCQDKVLALIDTNRYMYTSMYFENYFKYTSKTNITSSLLGITGILTFYPAIICSLIKYIKNTTQNSVSSSANSLSNQSDNSSFLTHNSQINSQYNPVSQPLASSTEPNGCSPFKIDTLKNLLNRFLFGHSKKTTILFIFGLSYIINILIFSRVMVFTRYNMRYLLAFAVIASPIIVYTYMRKINIYKIIVSIFLVIILAINAHAKPATSSILYIKYKMNPLAKQTNDSHFLLDDCDEFLMEAIELAVSMGQISASMLQRKFKVGYARAGRIIDQMEDRGIISGYQGSKPRQVLISKEEWEEMQEQGETSFDADDEEEYEEDA